jgi:hypothetical protein
MRLFCTFICICMASALAAQVLAKRVSFSYNRIPLKQVLNDISNDHAVFFAYSAEYIPLQQPVTVSVNSLPLSDALDKLFEPLPVAYRYIGGQVVLKPVQKEPVPRITQKPTPKEVQQQSPLYPDPRQEEMAAERRRRWAESAPLISQRKVGQVENTSQNGSAENLQVYQISPIVTEPPVAEEPTPPVDSTQVPPDSSALDNRVLQEVKTTPSSRLAQISLLPYLGTNALKSSRISNRLSINLLWGHNAGVEGVEVGGLVNSIRNDVKGVQVAGLGNAVGHDVIGSQIAGMFNISGDTIFGVQAGGVFNIAGQGNAIQTAGVFNIAGRDFAGVQASGLFNVAGENARSLQAAGLFNTSRGDARLQIGGLFNVSRGVNVGQVSSLINVAKQVKGFQIALLNVADTVNGISIGLLNFIRKGYNRVEIAGSDAFFGNLSFKIGVKPFYNILYLGARITKAPSSIPNNEIRELTWGLGYGLGTTIPFSRRFLVNLEAVFIKVNEREPWTTGLHQMYQFRLPLDLRTGRRSSIFAGPTFNILQSKRFSTEYGFGGSELVKKPWFDRMEGLKRTQGWMGFNVGIRI